MSHDSAVRMLVVVFFFLSADGDLVYQNSTFNYGYDLSLGLEALSIATENTFFVHT